MADKKYNEDELLDEFAEYIEGTYSEHYVGNNSIQTLDVWESLGIAEAMCQGTAIKYLMRYGKKAGRNRKDLLKALHFTLLLLHYETKAANEKIEDSKLADETAKKYGFRWKPIAEKVEEPEKEDEKPHTYDKIYRKQFEEAVRRIEESDPYVQTFILKNRPNL